MGIYFFFGDFNTFPSWAFPRRSFSLFPSSYLSFPPPPPPPQSPPKDCMRRKEKCCNKSMGNTWSQGFPLKNTRRKVSFGGRILSPGPPRMDEGKNAKVNYGEGETLVIICGDEWEAGKRTTDIMEFVSTQAIKNHKKIFSNVALEVGTFAGK